MNKIPKHVAIIPDGNRRWAKRRGLVGTKGHEKAGTYTNIIELCEAAQKLGIEYISAWGFSTENWKRSEKEIEIIMHIIEKLIDDLFTKKTLKYKLIHIGRKDRIPKSLRIKLSKIEKETRNNKFTLILAIDYGGQDEIIRAIKKTDKKQVTIENFYKNLDTANIPNPDLIIRTGGEKRLSGFMPYQSVYSELYFTKRFFPSFKTKDLQKAVKEYSRRNRRYGGN